MARQPIKALYITGRVSSAVKAQLKGIARTERRTLSQVISLLLEEALQIRQSKDKAA